MRCYHFQNLYLPGTHAGIQSAHTQHELALKYAMSDDQDAEAKASYECWARSHKVIILLNGGMSCHLEEIEEFFRKNATGFAWASFRESKEALNCAITNVGIVVPERIYQSRWMANHLSSLLDDHGFVVGGAGEVSDPDGNTFRLADYSDGSVGAIASLKDGKEVCFTAFEAALIQRIDRCPLI